jgi:single-strand DNA-binding protein
MGVNKAILIGNLGKDPEIRRTASQTAVATFSLATSERRKNSSGTWEDHTEWHRIVAFGKLAEFCGSYLKKGKQVYVEGKIRTNKWQDKQGQDRYTTEILAAAIQFVGRKEAGEAAADAGPIAAASSSFAADSLPSADDLGGPAEDAPLEDDDIPF